MLSECSNTPPRLIRLRMQCPYRSRLRVSSYCSFLFVPLSCGRLTDTVSLGGWESNSNENIEYRIENAEYRRRPTPPVSGASMTRAAHDHWLEYDGATCTFTDLVTVSGLFLPPLHTSVNVVGDLIAPDGMASDASNFHTSPLVPVTVHDAALRDHHERFALEPEPTSVGLTEISADTGPETVDEAYSSASSVPSSLEAGVVGNSARSSVA